MNILFAPWQRKLIDVFVQYLASLPINNGEDEGKIRKGCTILVRDKLTGRTYAFQVGDDTVERFAMTWVFANEKMERLAVNGQTRSFFTEDVANKRFGGAVANTQHIVSVSGWLAVQDEVLATIILAMLSVSKEGIMALKVAKGSLETILDQKDFVWGIHPYIQLFYTANVQSSKRPDTCFHLWNDFAKERGVTDLPLVA
ncbi:MAG: hypothetical protein HGA67_02265 [Candidatus Yonathbacteria bacterium]|nr:hypothetical protein [Candidatus Yonathbacteria bacterium]